MLRLPFSLRVIAFCTGLGWGR